MKKLLIICSVATLCLNFNAFGQKKMKNIICNEGTVAAYKYGFSPYKTEYKSYTKITQFAGGSRIISYNQTLPELYAVALGAGNTFPSNRVIVEDKEPEKLKKKYCYVLQVPAYLVNDMFLIMRQNLQYEYPDYIASIIQINGCNWLKISDKEEGILLNPIAKN